MKWRTPRWYESLKKRREDRRAPLPTTVAIVGCPRCGRSVRDNEKGRNAHGRSCVKIPRKRAAGWGQRG